MRYFLGGFVLKNSRGMPCTPVRKFY
jgi:hypothetical protein